MARSLTAQQESLAGKVWQLSDHRAALLRQLAEVELAQHQAIVVAEQHGVRQVRLAQLAGVTRARVSQIVAATDMPDEPTQVLDERWHRMLEWPQDHLASVAKITTVAARDEWNRRYELVHGSPGNLGASVPDNYT
ncbi:hypothetical protein BH11ACT2_BH11ACT2_01530 [soil metagenome]